jgi:glycosyltransferase involved in cell wall biosynthesis
MFSVIIPLYNKAPYLERAIDSVLNQSFKDYEIIVVNDGSTDGGGELVESKYRQQVQLINQENLGVSVARNLGIFHAKYPWIAFLDADDYWHKDYLFFVSKVISSYTDAKMIGASYRISGSLPNYPIFEVSSVHNYFTVAVKNTLFTSSSTVIHKSFFESNSGFKENLKKGEDIDVWCRAYDYFGKAYFINNPLVFYDTTASETINRIYPVISHFLQEMYSNYPISDQNKISWIEFRDKYLLLNLLFNLGDKKNYGEYIQLLSKLETNYFLAKALYWLPCPFFQKKLLLKYARFYLKFCFRYIYR